MSTERRSVYAIWISLFSNIVLTILKFVVGFLFSSQVLIADGVHNAGDVFATAAALVSMMVSKRDPDLEHPYGHGKAEVIGAGFVAVILVMAALYIGYHSALALWEPPHAANWLVFGAAALSLVWKQWLYMYTMRIGREIKSSGLVATAYDHLADVYASIAAVFGIGLSMAGEYFGIRFLTYGDPVAGIVVAFLVLRLAIHMGRSSIDILMEKNIDEDKMKQLKAIVLSVPWVKRIDRIRAREHGHYIIADVRVAIPAELSVAEGHDVTRRIKHSIQEQMVEVSEVLVHINPWYEGTEPKKV
nr:cation diffusion facilitator family transporter [Paenibacillus antri]